MVYANDSNDRNNLWPFFVKVEPLRTFRLETFIVTYKKFIEKSSNLVFELHPLNLFDIYSIIFFIRKIFIISFKLCLYR